MTDLAVRPELLRDLPDQTQRQLRDYRDLLLRWNQPFKLISLREPDEIDTHLIADALRLLPAIDAALPQAAESGPPDKTAQWFNFFNCFRGGWRNC